MKRYQFGGIQGDNFREFLNICFSHSNYFTLSKDVPNGYDLVPNSAEVALSPYLIKTVSTESWYGFEQISTNMVQNIYYSQKEPMQIQLWWYFPTIKKKIKENFCWYCREKTKIGKYIWKSVFFLKKGYAFRNSVTWILLFDKWNWWKVCERIIACWGMGKNKCVGVGCWKNIFNAIFIKIQEKS